MHLNSMCLVPARTQFETDRTLKPPAPPQLDPQRISAAAYTLIIVSGRLQGHFHHHHLQQQQDEDDRLRRTDSERPTVERIQPPDIPIVESAR